jgi:hypothetical protein
MRQKQACIAKSHTSYYSLSEKNKDLALIWLKEKWKKQNTKKITIETNVDMVAGNVFVVAVLFVRALIEYCSHLCE